MLPLKFDQLAVYRFGQAIPPHDPRVDDHGPVWHVISFNFVAYDNQNIRVPVQPDFHLIAIGISNSSNLQGGFRAQFYDVAKDRRLADRGIQQALLGGSAASPGPFFLREPYVFDEPDSQIMISAQNLEAVNNNVQIVLYGMARPDWVYGNTLPPKP